MEGSKSAGDPNPRLEGHPNPLAFLDEGSKSAGIQIRAYTGTYYWRATIDTLCLYFVSFFFFLFSGYRPWTSPCGREAGQAKRTSWAVSDVESYLSHLSRKCLCSRFFRVSKKRIFLRNSGRKSVFVKFWKSATGTLSRPMAHLWSYKIKFHRGPCLDLWRILVATSNVSP